VKPEDWTVYPIPLGPDRIARVHLPNDLSAQEAEKVAAVVRSLGDIQK